VHLQVACSFSCLITHAFLRLEVVAQNRIVAKCSKFFVILSLGYLGYVFPDSHIFFAELSARTFSSVTEILTV
jgi:hypothetical protein